MAVDLGYYGCYLVEGGRGEGVQEVVADAEDVGGETVDAVGVDAAEIGEDEGFGYDLGIFWGHAVPF